MAKQEHWVQRSKSNSSPLSQRLWGKQGASSPWQGWREASKELPPARAALLPSLLLRQRKNGNRLQDQDPVQQTQSGSYLWFSLHQKSSALQNTRPPFLNPRPPWCFTAGNQVSNLGPSSSCNKLLSVFSPEHRVGSKGVAGESNRGREEEKRAPLRFSPTPLHPKQLNGMEAEAANQAGKIRLFCP